MTNEEAHTMMTERKIEGFFQPYKDGYTRQINACTRLFIPAAGVSRYDPQTGELFTVAPIYPEKAPAQDATTPDVKASLEERSVGGLGIFMVKKMAKSVAYRREGDRNVLTVVM